ncbi:DUF4244 domain-containing protein [Jiangella alkaliphila]|uniref:DUF4244 domain-containing protein n=1 Tax=Jiangella alkaliphila TaxID=419479 RepID=A0A1H2GRF3_9ACTN|nr:DUF4244 domain-containing protein [Jiangella alkaliphila]SDU21908.1 Protein of unknown function [Jiangella alkaliphila]
MSKIINRFGRLRSERGMTTAEYAVGTVAACGFGGVLYKLLTSEPIQDLLSNVIDKAFGVIGG